jgi:hypothetical protein
MLKYLKAGQKIENLITKHEWIIVDTNTINIDTSLYKKKPGSVLLLERKTGKLEVRYCVIYVGGGNPFKPGSLYNLISFLGDRGIDYTVVDKNSLVNFDNFEGVLVLDNKTGKLEVVKEDFSSFKVVNDNDD